MAVVGGSFKWFSAVAVFFMGVVIFSVAVVAPGHTVAVVLVEVEHKERAAGKSPISEIP